VIFFGLAASGTSSVQAGLQGGGHVSARAHLLVGIITLASLLFIVRLVRRKGLKSKYSLLWLAIGIIMGTIAVFPGLLAQTSYKLGIYYPPATFLAFSVAFLFLVVVQFSWELSRLEDRTRTLAEELALLRAAHDELAAAQREGRPPRERVGARAEDDPPTP
jgi:hypothetical protein